MDKLTLYHIKAAFEQDGSNVAYKEVCRLCALEEALENKIKTIDDQADVSKQLPLAEIEKFIWETAEDYHLWDEESQGQYPVKRMLDAMNKWWTVISKQ